MLDILTDLKKWLRNEGEDVEVLLGLDNLIEYNSKVIKNLGPTSGAKPQKMEGLRNQISN